MGCEWRFTAASDYKQSLVLYSKGERKTMRLFSLVLILLFFPTIASAQAPPRNPTPASPASEECSVSGMVVKLAGSEPLKNATVQLQNPQDLAHTISVVTDAGGRFELKGIDAGRYRLKVSRTGFVTQEYGQKSPNDPGTEIRLSPGQNWRGLLFRMIPWGVIAGRVLNEDGDPLPWAQVSALREVYSSGKRKLSTEALVPTNDLGEYRLFGLKPGRYFICAKYRPGRYLSSGSSNRQANIENPDGSFEFAGVSPGSYTLSAFWFEDGRRYQARQPLEVGNANVEGANLTIAPGITISGRIIWDGKPGLDRADLFVSLVPVDSTISFNAPARATGSSFSLKDVFDGTYRLGVVGQSKDCYLKSIRYGSNEALETGFTVFRGTQLPLEVTISSRGAHAQGAVTDKDGLPVTGVWVVLVPDESRRDQFRLYQKASADQYGHFLLRGIPPGDYKIFCWEEVEDGAWEDPDFLRPFEDRGQKVSVEESDTKTVDVVAIRTKSPE